MCWLLSVFGIALVCAKYDIIIPKILSFILNVRQVQTSLDEECVCCYLYLASRQCMQDKIFLFLKDYILLWTRDKSGRVQTRHMFGYCRWVQNMIFLFLKYYLLFWKCYTSRRVQTSVCARKRYRWCAVCALIRSLLSSFDWLFVWKKSWHRN